MQINYYKVNPGGNITGIVVNSIQKHSRISVAKAILESDKTIEQVGFWLPSSNKQSAGRIEMMGNEFCGNATRSLVYLLWLKNQERRFIIESSGIDEPITSKAFKDYSEIYLPISGFRVSKIEQFIIIKMPGITHLITETNLNKAQSLAILKRFDLLREKAVGVIVVKKNGTEITIKPFVWVTATQTFYEETACASGSLAVAFAYALGNNKRFIILQPSGYKLLVKLSNQLISIGGPVVSVEKKQLKIS